MAPKIACSNVAMGQWPYFPESNLPHFQTGGQLATENLLIYLGNHTIFIYNI